MEKIRIGKDFKIKWAVNINNRPITSSDDVKIYVINPNKGYRRVDYFIENGIVIINYKGDEWDLKGYYSLALYYDKEYKSVLDAINVFQLVGSTKEESIEGNLINQEITITGNCFIAGKSAYESWLDLGNIGTEQDFIDSLKGEGGITNIADGSITDNKLANNAVTTDKIKDNAVTGKKIATKAINHSHLNTNCVGTDNLASNAVTYDKLEPIDYTNSKNSGQLRTSDGYGHLIIKQTYSFTIESDNGINSFPTEYLLRDITDMSTNDLLLSFNGSYKTYDKNGNVINIGFYPKDGYYMYFDNGGYAFAPVPDNASITETKLEGVIVVEWIRI